MKNILKLCIVFIALLIGFYILRHIKASMPDSESSRERESRLKGKELESCLAKARTDYDSLWNQSCRELGRGSDCSRPSRVTQTGCSRWVSHLPGMYARTPLAATANCDVPAPDCQTSEATI